MIAQVLSRLGFGTHAAAAENSLATLKARGAKLEAALADTQNTLSTAQGKVNELQSALSEAENIYIETPSEKVGKRITDTRAALELARLSLRKPQAAVDAATHALDAWRAELSAAEGALDQAKRADQVAELRVRATLEHFNAQAAEPRERLRDALADVSAAADEITALWKATNDAASELDAAGEPTDKLSAVHLIAPLVLEHAEQHPEAADALWMNLPSVATACLTPGSWLTPGVYDLGHALRGPLFAALATPRGETRPELREIAVKKLRAALAEATVEQGRKAAVDTCRSEVCEFERTWQRAADARAHADFAAQRAIDAQEIEENQHERGVAVQDPAFARAYASREAELDARRTANGEQQEMSRARANLKAQATGDGLFSRIAPPSEHFTRLNE